MIGPRTVSRWIDETMFTVSSWYEGVTYNDKLYINGERVNAATFFTEFLKARENATIEGKELIILDRQLLDSEVQELYQFNLNQKHQAKNKFSFNHY